MELATAIRKGELSPVDVTEHYLARMAERNESVGAFFTIAADSAREQARAAEKAVTVAQDPAALPPLTGVPVPVKDLNLVAGMRATLGSEVFRDFIAPEDDYVAASLRAAGAVITGKTATPLFGLPCSTE
ncbi:MAG: amidase, partial [Streptosporangiaceae bacterium]|nr:amidase [Streptosporangiaceae bacterium]